MRVKLPKVSIIIPVYNGSNYLSEAIESALAQTYENVEIIVVNDGSNDEGATEQIAKSYGKKIKYYSKENGGVATALNLGIKKMTGEYFSWLSHDDLYYQDKIEKQINFLEKSGFDKVFLYSNYAILRDQQITPVKHNHEMLVRKPKYSMLRGCVNGITVLIPKSILDEMGEFDPELRCTQDYDYWRRIERKYKFVHMEDVLSITRLHSQQDSIVSPRVIAEGDVLWIDMIRSLSDREKISYENTLLNFYTQMTTFLETTPYTGALEYSRNELTRAQKAFEKEVFNPTVSVVIPFYNRPEKTIAAVKSVQNQSYKNIEIILVDDCSTDNMSDLQRLIKNSKNIKLISCPKNSGPAVARNLGIRSSTGEYIAFLDNDDEFLPNKLEVQLGAMAKYNRNFSYTSYIKREQDVETVKCDPGLTGIVVPRIISNCSIATPTVVVRRDILLSGRMLFNESIRIGEDTCLWLEIAKCFEMLLVEAPLTIVNVDSDTHSQDNSKLMIGVKNLLNYLINDDYYTNYNHDISILGNYLFEISNQISERERSRLLYDGPVVSSDPAVLASTPEPVTAKSIVRSSIPYRAARKIYRKGIKILGAKHGTK